MARLRKFVCYRRIERPNTRKSKYRKKSFVRGNPALKIVKFNIGNLTDKFQYRLDLVTKQDLQIRDNALESARQTCNKILEKTLGKNGFRLQVRVFPHHILREHALAAGAGADRFSSGMAHSFGKPVGNAAQMKNGQKLFSVFVNEANITLGRESLRRARNKLPGGYSVSVVKM